MRRVLVVSTIPVPPIEAGNQKCIAEYCDLLQSMGTEVHFLFVKGRKRISHDAGDYWKGRFHVFHRLYLLDGLKRLFITVRKSLTGYNHVDDLYPIGLTRHVLKLHKEYNFSAIIINYIILSRLFMAEMTCTKALYAHDCMSFKKKRLGLRDFWFDLTPNEEAKGLQRCDAVLSIQANERIYFQYLHPKGLVSTVYSYFKVHPIPLTGNKNVLFLSGDSLLNLNGINWFIERVWDKVLAEEPQAHLVIAGGICRKLKSVDKANVDIIGRVEKEEDLYKLGDISINPVFQGTGLKIKTFESLSFGRVTIVHPHSAEGIYKPELAPLMIGETEEEFARELVSSLRDMDLRKKVSEASIRYIEALDAYIEERYREIIHKEG